MNMKLADYAIALGYVVSFLFMCHSPKIRVFDLWNLIGVLLMLVCVSLHMRKS